MKKFLFLIPALAVLFLNSCNKDKDQIFTSCSFSVTVDHTKSIDDMITAGHYDVVSNKITDNHFGDNNSYANQEEIITITLLGFDGKVTFKEAVKKIKAEGYRPATSAEFLAMTAQHPNSYRNNAAVAAGTTWKNGVDVKEIIGACTSGAEKRLFVDWTWMPYQFTEGYMFAAVKN